MKSKHSGQLKEELNSITSESVQERKAFGSDATSAAMGTNLSTPSLSIDTNTIQNVPALPKPRPKPSSLISDKKFNALHTLWDRRTPCKHS